MFGRRKSQNRVEKVRAPLPDPVAQPPRDELPRPKGPWDLADVDLDDESGDATNRVDLGGLLVTGRPGLELRLQVDERTQTVAAVLLVAADSAVELRAFAAPRNEDLWDDVRRELAAEATRRGGTATEQQGPHGSELRINVPVQTPDGRRASQISRVVGVSAPRWLLRATFLGRAATEPDPHGLLEEAFRDVIVRRGSDPMAPRSPLPLQMPPPTGEQPPPAEADPPDSSAG